MCMNPRDMSEEDIERILKEEEQTEEDKELGCPCCGCKDPDHDVGECSLGFMAPGMESENRRPAPYGMGFYDEYGSL